MLRFFLSIDPPTVTQQEHCLGVSRNGKPYVYEDQRLADARAKLTAYLNQHKPDAPMDGPLALSCVWFFHSDSHKDFEWKVSKPDTDNLQKMLKDCMTALGFWHDDAQVVRELAMKQWVRKEPPGILISLWPERAHADE